MFSVIGGIVKLFSLGKFGVWLLTKLSNSVFKSDCVVAKSVGMFVIEPTEAK